MKLSELVGYLNLLNQESVTPDFDQAMRKFYALAHIVKHHNLQFDAVTNDFNDAIKQVQDSFDTVSITMQNLKDHIGKSIELLEVEQYKQSERLYYDEMPTELPEYILNRRLRIDDDSNILIRSHMKNLTDWRLPGMIIRPGLDSFIEDLVPLDPLYLVDQHLDLLTPAVSAFTPEYQRRLRTYIVDDYQHGHPLWELPDDQFGLIFVWNFFNYKPLSVVYRYLADCWKKLRPGGTMIFTYNDCDDQNGARLAECNFMTYTPGRILKAHLEHMGFDVIFKHRGAGDLSWFEVRKPGQIKTIRGGQTLAKIIATQ